MKSMAIETRVSTRALATCALAFESQGMGHFTKSGLVAACVQTLADALERNMSLPSIEDDSVAEFVISRTTSTRKMDMSLLSDKSLQQQVLDAADNLKASN